MVVPTDEIYKERVAAQAAAGNKDIPDEAIMEMKGIGIIALLPFIKLNTWQYCKLQRYSQLIFNRQKQFKFLIILVRFSAFLKATKKSSIYLTNL